MAAQSCHACKRVPNLLLSGTGEKVPHGRGGVGP